jgi:hypothetical protein
MNLQLLEDILDRYINRTAVWPDGTVVFIKELVGSVRQIKIEMYANDHNPPHFHAKSRCGSIDAVFSLVDCSLIKGSIERKDQLRVQQFYEDNKEKLLKYWEEKVFKQR